MKKLVLTTLAVVACAMLTHAQGLVSLQTGKGTVQTNATLIGGGIGNAYAGANSYYYELLDMTIAQWGGLTANQQAGAAALASNPGDISLWTDSGINGVNAGGLTSGGIAALGAAGGTTAANWAAPGSSYATSDYYVIIGWSSNLGTSYGAISNNLATASSGFFGETPVAYNSAGGGASSLPVVNVWLPSTATGISGSGESGTNPELVLYSVPEPTTLALAGLGGLSMLFLRRRK